MWDWELMARRARWALGHLAFGRLAVADAYLVLDVAPTVSVGRRVGQLAMDHPWSRIAELERLRRFYLSPLDALRGIDGNLAAAFAGVCWRSASGEHTTPDEVAIHAMVLAQELSGWR